ncbi:DUF7544 domain-containing protein [Streptomyces aidingensis]|uniref:Membrane domain of glycerophosphoryl diester phosphodiesterase n=1 Tax=Streptomyces aidingensis TaxID=910347 RepID=A0A1I1E325_9ACTN|nr:hypothetical protein [Streptomyces aidingensis]SFB79233.1 hypothetical protein SAMN05421773_1017 [Streptomyces aidingensis]
MSDRWTSPGSPQPEDEPQQQGSAEQPRLDKTPPQGWSENPPPPAGWSGPGAPGGPGAPPPQQGWSGPGWGAPGWGPPAAPKPGVIPLRPLGVGEILDGAVSTARAHWRPVLAISLAISVVVQVVTLPAMRAFLGEESDFAALTERTEPTDEELRAAFGDLFAFTSITGVVTILGVVLATAMLTMVVSRAVLGRGVTVGEAWAESRGQVLRLLGLVVLLPLIGAVAVAVPLLLAALTGFAPLVVLVGLGAVALMLWLMVQFSLAAPALMLERQGVFHAMRRSWKLVAGSWWRIFGIQLLAFILLLFVSGMIELPIDVVARLVSGDEGDFLTGSLELSWTYLAITGVGGVLSSTVTLPISAGVTALLYMDQRIRREALDLELARAAGADGPATPGGAAGPAAPQG